jgi:hypothetical protein
MHLNNAFPKLEITSPTQLPGRTRRRTRWRRGLKPFRRGNRLFDPATRTWSIYWADSRFPGPLEQPVVGSFSGDVGIFECRETFNGEPIIVPFTWSQTSSPTVRWEQAFSADDGQTWETNHITESTRVAATA